MVGPFFPKQVKFASKHEAFKIERIVYWSPANVKINAWKGRSMVNKIATFEKGSVYTVLAEEKNWKFVLVKAAPKADKKNTVINPENFKETSIFGWIPKDEN